MAAVLAIEGSSGRDEASDRGAQLLDSLSYVDPLSEAEKRAAEALIDAETKRSPLRVADYMQRMGDMPSLEFPNNPLLKGEFERIAAQQPMAQMDMRRFELPEPRLQQREDVDAWRSAADNAAAQLEHQLDRIMNLELALKYAPNLWRAHNARTAAIAQQLEKQSEELAAEITRTNQRRKLQQLAAASELEMAETVYYGLTKKNVEIEVACQTLQAEIEVLEARVARATAAAPNGMPTAVGTATAAGMATAAAANGAAAEGAVESPEANGAANGAAAAAADEPSVSMDE